LGAHSPPERAGAANPWSHDRSWKLSAYSASCNNLQALRELDSKLVAGVPPSLASAAAGVACAGAVFPASDASSSDSSSTAQLGEAVPFTCHTQYFL
jgi:hypothetical protein